jgi:hypothetical protein
MQAGTLSRRCPEAKNFASRRTHADDFVSLHPLPRQQANGNRSFNSAVRQFSADDRRHRLIGYELATAERRAEVRILMETQDRFSELLVAWTKLQT